MKQPSSPAVRRLAAQRQELESRYGDLRRALDHEIGWAPAKAWILPLSAFASSLALAAWLVGRRKKG